MNRWNCFLLLRLAMTAALVIGTWHGGTTLAADGDAASDEAVEIKPYTGKPVFLDEPEPQPPASLVEKRVDSDKYADGKIRVEREIARYSDNRYVADGYYREFYPNGEKFAEGQYKSGRQEGTWTYWHDNGQECRQVAYKNGQPDGGWDVHNPDGAVIAKRSYKNGRRDGTWAVYDDSGKQQLREEQYADGKADGVWKVWFPSGQQKTQIEIQAGKRHGAAIEWDEKGNKRAELNYDEGKVHGKVTLRGPDGQTIVQTYDQGTLVSESKE